MKLWNLVTLSIVSLLTFSGCSGAKPAPADKVVIDSTLPLIELTKNGIIADMNSIAFEWKSINDPRVEGIYIYKNTQKNGTDSKLEYYKTINSRFKTHFIDSYVLPDTKYYYSFATFAQDVQSPMSNTVVVNSLPVLESVSWIHSITGMPRTAKIIWRPHENQKVKEYIIERRTLEDKEWKRLAVVEGRLNAEYIDTDLKDKYIYMYRIRVVTFDEITSTPSQIVRVVTKALPQSVNNIITTINLPRKIELKWDASTQKDFKFYYVYRSENVDGNYKLIATLHNNRYTNKIDEDGKIYFYRVSVVDKDDLESIHDKNSIEGMTLVKPKAPAIVDAKNVGSTIEIVWHKTDPRIQLYTLVKKHKKGWFDETIEKINDLQDTKYIDKGVESDSTYSYVLYGVDKFGIVSEASNEVRVVIPESKDFVKAPKSNLNKEESVSKQKESKEVIINSDDLDLSGL